MAKLLESLVKKHGVFLIAEACSNHEGDIEVAKKMIVEAAKSGANAIKFQDFSLTNLFAPEVYCKALKLKNNALCGIENITFKNDWYKELLKVAKANNIILFSTPFSIEAVNRMEQYNLSMYKIASCDIDNIPLLKAIAKTKKPVIVSTGLSTNEEIKRTLKILNQNEVALLHCSVEYPTTVNMARLNRIEALKKQFGKNIIGYSDHTIGLDAMYLSISLGAKIIEKHFTIDEKRTSGDHIISINGAELKTISNYIKNIESLLGGSKALEKDKVLSKQEKKELVYAKRGIYLKTDMKKGDKLKESDLITLRPNIGISSADWDKVVGKKLAVNKKALAPLKKNDIL